MSRHRAPEPEQKQGEGVSPIAAVIAIVCVLGLAVALMMMAGSDRTSAPMNVNGDFVGMDSGEDVAAYAARAAGTLADPPAQADGMASGPGDAHWALVSFDPPAEPAAAAAAVDGLDGLRAGTMYVGQIVSRSLPEPVAGQTRADVIERELDLLRRSAGPVVRGTGDANLTGLLVRGTLDQLRTIAGRPGVAAVEALAADAVIGRFGVRPLPLPEPGPDPVPAPAPEGAPDAPAPEPSPAPEPAPDPEAAPL
ncbi:hypothetical protein ACFWGD_03450 [Corynebacterium sp. NPDC060344]|uniref:hypothetical protein n=1 Tax=Corynebacterium sp. NPDC060344 TaxID=3347101 RepID=UPI00365FB71F